jgi:hypothetical protein
VCAARGARDERMRAAHGTAAAQPASQQIA